jgi:hypothetical protein
MKYRKLRIAWSVFWGLAALLLLASWARSYWYYDYVNYRHSGGWSGRGTVCIVSTSRYSSSPWRPKTQRYSENSKPEWIRKFAPPVSWKYEPGYLAVWIAYWLVLLIPAMLSVLPWIRLRFKLRTLLVVTTLFALVLTVFGWIPRQ